MPKDQLDELTAEADLLLEQAGDAFASDRYDQPAGVYVREAQELLGDDAPWHRIAYVAHALRVEEEAEA